MLGYETSYLSVKIPTRFQYYWETHFYVDRAASCFLTCIWKQFFYVCMKAVFTYVWKLFFKYVFTLFFTCAWKLSFTCAWQLFFTYVWKQFLHTYVWKLFFINVWNELDWSLKDVFLIFVDVQGSWPLAFQCEICKNGLPLCM
jgi:hypothetical protein